MRQTPPEQMPRVPGPKALLYYLPRDPELQALDAPVPRSTRTIWKIWFWCKNADALVIVYHTSFATEEQEVVSLKNNCRREFFKEGLMKHRDHKFEVTLSEEQRYALHQLISSGKAPARKLAHARILLKIDRNTPGNEWTDEQVAEAFEVSRSTVLRIRERFVENGLDDALNHRHAPRARSRRLDGAQEAHLIALSCSPCPEGHARWTLRMLADRMVQLEYSEQVSL
jgi:hypothetical protein